VYMLDEYYEYMHSSMSVKFVRKLDRFPNSIYLLHEYYAESLLHILTVFT
jgi:hypothetical protein